MDAARAALNVIWKAALPRDQERLGNALRDRALLVALEDMLIPFVTYGMNSDFRRLRASKVLSIDDTNGHPDLAAVFLPNGKTLDTLPAGYKVGLAPSNEGPPRVAVTTAEAYQRYFDWYIAAKAPDGKSGVDAFYDRYPLLKHAVDTVSRHFQQNIELACKRILRNWIDIRTAFFDGKSMKLAEIESTGNDFHKGGKQVLILTFDLPGGEKGRVVYKPSAVEIDCRIVGDSSVFKKVRPKAEKDEQRYTQTESLTELLNRLHPTRVLRRDAKSGHVVTSRPLPTYRILPYNRRSVKDGYGYLQFLTHDPALPVSAGAEETLIGAAGREIAKFSPLSATIQQSDWITANPDDALVFFDQYGGLAAMVLAISVSDMHVQNVIVHKRSPHLIDLEDALRQPMTRVEDTQLMGENGALNKYEDKGSKYADLRHDQTSDVLVNWVMSPGLATSALWVLDVNLGPARPARLWPAGAPDSVENRKAFFAGFDQMMATIATLANAEMIKWADGVGGTLARFVTVATREYAPSSRNLYANSVSHALTYQLRITGSRSRDEDWYSKVIPNDAGLSFFDLEVDKRRKAWNRPRPPFWALEHPDHVWFDYLNCDVPSFYHHLDSDDLLNSRGDVVNVTEAVRWQTEHCKGVTDQPRGWELDSRPGAYFPPVSGKEMVKQQLRDLSAVWQVEAQRRQWLERALSMTSLAAVEREAVSSLAPAGQVAPGTRS